MGKNLKSDIGVFSLNTVLFVQRVVGTWFAIRREKFFKDIGLGNVYRRRAKTARSVPYLISDLFDHIRTRNSASLPDIVREIIRVEWYLLEFERRRKSLMDRTLAELFVSKHPQLVDSLKRDGYSLQDGELVLMSREELEKNTTALGDRLRKAGFAVPVSHYEQAWENYVLSNFEAANAQLRSFLQALFDEMALKLYPDAVKPEELGGARRLALQKRGFIENDKHGSFLKSFFELSNTKGAHPGLSTEEESRLRAVVSTEIAAYYLSKYESIKRDV